MNMIRLMGVIILSIWIYGCGGKPAEAPAAVPVPVPAPAPAPAPVAAPDGGKDVWGDMPTPVAAPAIVPTETIHVPTAVNKALLAEESAVNKYKVQVQATSKINKYLDPSIQSAGALWVWIGQPGYEPPTQSGMSAASGILETTIKAVSAKITPDFPDDPFAFDVKPNESKCQGVESRGTTVAFAIIPKQLGTFRVGARVELYKTEDCSGPTITRTADPITVKVVVGIDKLPFYQEIWAAFMKFFKEFLAICFALLLFIFRKKLKKIFSFEKES